MVSQNLRLKELRLHWSPVEKEAIILSTKKHNHYIECTPVLGFHSGIFQDWKVMEKGYWSWKFLEIC